MTNYIVESKSRDELRALALSFRRFFKLEKCIRFPIVEILDILVDISNQEFSYEIVEDDELPKGTHADTNIRTGHIRIKESVYNRACNGEGRDRMTIAHEIGHFLMLCLCGFKLERNFSKECPAFQDPEWQAKCFAGELLVPYYLVRNLSSEEIAQQCEVSLDAAKIQYNHIHEGGDENCV